MKNLILLILSIMLISQAGADALEDEESCVRQDCVREAKVLIIDAVTRT